MILKGPIGWVYVKNSGLFFLLKICILSQTMLKHLTAPGQLKIGIMLYLITCLHGQLVACLNSLNLNSSLSHDSSSHSCVVLIQEHMHADAAVWCCWKCLLTRRKLWSSAPIFGTWAVSEFAVEYAEIHDKGLAYWSNWQNFHQWT